eukprot:1463710-Pyramimonas_sp.AAC.2
MVGGAAGAVGNAAVRANVEVLRLQYYLREGGGGSGFGTCQVIAVMSMYRPSMCNRRRNRVRALRFHSKPRAHTLGRVRHQNLGPN